MSKTTSKFSPEVRQRAVPLVFDQEHEHPSRWAAIMSIAAKIGCRGQTLNEWVKTAEVDAGKRAGVPADMATKLKALERRTGSFGRPTRSCARRALNLPRRSSTVHPNDDRLHRRSSRGPRGRADLQGAADRTRAKRDMMLKPEIERVSAENFEVYGARKV